MFTNKKQMHLGDHTLTTVIRLIIITCDWFPFRPGATWYLLGNVLSKF